jgi:hypothetical protein
MIVRAYHSPPIKTAWLISQIHSKLNGNIINPPNPANPKINKGLKLVKAESHKKGFAG